MYIYIDIVSYYILYLHIYTCYVYVFYLLPADDRSGIYDS